MELTAGTTISATKSITDGQSTYSRSQAAYLVHLAYETGRLHGAAENIAEAVACWEEFAQPAPTREQRVAGRLAEMAAGAERERRRHAARPRPYAQTFEAMDWPETAVPGTVDVATLRGEWTCPCPRDENGGHVTPQDEPRKRRLVLVTGPAGGIA